VVGTTSEVLTTDMRRRIHDAWNVHPCDIYGTTEAAVPAASRQHQIGMDIIHAALTHGLQAAGAVAPPIEVTAVPELRREETHGAKFKLIQTATR
jgi:acyl-coenzyme A synthetase/AMP-(fatty) acid ligase